MCWWLQQMLLVHPSGKTLATSRCGLKGSHLVVDVAAGTVFGHLLHLKPAGSQREQTKGEDGSQRLVSCLTAEVLL